MKLYELLLIAIGLSMDAFAVSLCKGLTMKKLNHCRAVTIALFFGGFQAAMPFIGWLLGRQFEQYITRFDHWIAFVLLAFIGGKMLWDAITEKEDSGSDSCEDRFNIQELFILSVATSIDALAVGITFAFFNMPILPSISLIGCTTFVLSYIGVVLGNRFGIKYKNKAKMVGGIVLIAIGIKILIDISG